jgi:glutathione peroxidase
MRPHATKAAVLLICIAAVGPSLAAPPCPALLDRQMPRLQDEKPQNLCQYAGQVLLVVNTASFCGFTPQYTALEMLYSRLRPRGLVVLGFPSNDFGAQEPGTGKDIAALCENTFGVKFPMFAKSRVAASAGAALNPLFADLAKRTGKPPQWNFHKYLVARDGQTVFGTSKNSLMQNRDRSVIFKTDEFKSLSHPVSIHASSSDVCSFAFYTARHSSAPFRGGAMPAE